VESEGSELSRPWRSSTFSTQEDCVECRADQGRVLVRDSKNVDGGMLSVPASEWAAFTASLG